MPGGVSDLDIDNRVFHHQPKMDKEVDLIPQIAAGSVQSPLDQAG